MVRICLEADVIVDFLRGSEEIEEKMKYYIREDLCITIIDYLELLARVKNKHIISYLLDFLEVLPLTEKEAELAANILASMKRSRRNAVKIALKAAICLSNNALFFVKHRKDYKDIPKLRLV